MSYPIIDGHCDTLTLLNDSNISLNYKTTNHLTIEDLRAGNVKIQFFAAWIGSKKKYGPCLQRCLFLIDTFYKMLDRYQNDFQQVLSYEDAIKAIRSDKIGAVLTIEGGEALEGSLENLRIFYRLGVRLITLTWNHRNELADGVLENKGGLSNFGQSVVKEMNNLGMIIDTSHISEKSFYDVLNITASPIVASHSNAKAICPHPRNLTDNQIKAMAINGGLIGINFYNPFVAEENANIDKIINHIEHICSLVGPEYLAFGSDFDGIDQLPDDICGPEDYNKIINRLLRLNYNEDTVRKICSENYLRLLRDTLSVRRD